MNIVQQIVDFISQLFRWWFIVLPWEQAVRVRCGKTIAVFGAGIHFQIPFLDMVYLQNTRRRLTTIHAQLVSTLDGKTVVVSGTIGYKIDSILRVHQTLHQAADTVRMGAQMLITEFIVGRKLIECTPAALTSYVRERLDLERYGLCDTEFFLTNFATVKTYRMITGEAQSWSEENFSTNYPLGTDNAPGARPR